MESLGLTLMFVDVRVEIPLRYPRFVTRHAQEVGKL
jgi:hypothetical protein